MATRCQQQLTVKYNFKAVTMTSHLIFSLVGSKIREDLKIYIYILRKKLQICLQICKIIETFWFVYSCWMTKTCCLYLQTSLLLWYTQSTKEAFAHLSVSHGDRCVGDGRKMTDEDDIKDYWAFGITAPNLRTDLTEEIRTTRSASS